jgi:prevent-host-death family protein
MTIHVNIGEAKTRLSELVAASLRGEEVVLNKAGRPVARLVPIAEASEDERKARAAKRVAAIGMYRDAFEGWNTDIGPSMTDEEVEARIRRIVGPDN